MKFFAGRDEARRRREGWGHVSYRTLQEIKMLGWEVHVAPVDREKEVGSKPANRRA